MNKKYGRGILIGILGIYACVFYAYALAIMRSYKHLLRAFTNGHELHLFVLAVYAVMLIVLVFLLYYFIVRIFLRLNLVALKGETLVIRPINIFKQPTIVALDDITSMHFIADTTSPELTITTTGDEFNTPVLANYLELRDLYETLEAAGLSVYLSGPSMPFFGMEKMKLRGVLFIFYATIVLLVCVFLSKLSHLGVHKSNGNGNGNGRGRGRRRMGSVLHDPHKQVTPAAFISYPV